MTNLVYLNNRHHDPTLGMFVSVDPLVTTTGEPYIYGGANPITYSDPSGLCKAVKQGFCTMNGAIRQATPPPVPLPDPPSQEDIDDAIDRFMAAPGINLLPNAPERPSDAADAAVWDFMYGGVADKPVSFGVWLDESRTVDVLKNFGVALVAGSVAMAVCTTGVGCVLVVGAVAGAVTNLGVEVGIDLADGSLDMSSRQLGGHALEGAVRGGGAAIVGYGMNVQIGHGGVVSALRYEGGAATTNAVLGAASTRSVVLLNNAAVSAAIDGG